jgi:hypothetical protein
VSLREGAQSGLSESESGVRGRRVQRYGQTNPISLRSFKAHYRGHALLRGGETGYLSTSRGCRRCWVRRTAAGETPLQTSVHRVVHTRSQHQLTRTGRGVRGFCSGAGGRAAVRGVAAHGQLGQGEERAAGPVAVLPVRARGAVAHREAAAQALPAHAQGPRACPHHTPLPQREGDSGGGLTREVETPLPSNRPRCDQVMPFQLSTIPCYTIECYGWLSLSFSLNDLGWR